jgi:ferredoxin hydrogenase small subunit
MRAEPALAPSLRREQALGSWRVRCGDARRILASRARPARAERQGRFHVLSGPGSHDGGAAAAGGRTTCGRRDLRGLRRMTSAGATPRMLAGSSTTVIRREGSSADLARPVASGRQPGGLSDASGWVMDPGRACARASGRRPRPSDGRALRRQLVHHGCPRNEFYEFKASAEKPSTWAFSENMGQGDAGAPTATPACGTDRPYLRGPCHRCTAPGSRNRVTPSR